MGLFNDILKEKSNGKFSQGRVYLFFSVFAYYFVLGLLLFFGMHASKDADSDVDLDAFKIIIESLKYALLLFAGYVFGDKFLRVVEAISSIMRGQPIPPKKDDKQVLND